MIPCTPSIKFSVDGIKGKRAITVRIDVFLFTFRFIFRTKVKDIFINTILLNVGSRSSSGRTYVIGSLAHYYGS